MKPVVHSHLIPESLYLHVTDGESSPIRVGDGVVMPTDRHIKSYLLCLDCEDILSKGSETWVCPKLAWVDRRFPLYDLLEAAGGYPLRWNLATLGKRGGHSLPGSPTAVP
jgi:hypothetical protein